ncbi:hypothetical protein GXW71_33685 [Roseomonas hellenica]|uniref:Uncharacterized protein n=1 Tax=Plastoroseomonas hellenica TaxID=2687306 RepID=A0ABS5F9W2_9PROT|nr:hypothetical protein [Plastoroseomonas hellenica]MBR0669350.1 hypothetical protein [Plastoroseomonas hellenica]
MRAPCAFEAAARNYLSLCDAPPAAPSLAQAVRALGRHIPCATLYADQAGRCKVLAAWCRGGGGVADLLYAERHAAWGVWWRRMEQAQRFAAAAVRMGATGVPADHIAPDSSSRSRSNPSSVPRMRSAGS